MHYMYINALYVYIPGSRKRAGRADRRAGTPPRGQGWYEYNYVYVSLSLYIYIYIYTYTYMYIHKDMGGKAHRESARGMGPNLAV